MDLEILLKECWKEIREEFYYPNIPNPGLIDDKSTAHIDMVNHEIKINKNFVSYLKEKGVDEKTSLRGLLAHELNHYLKCPFDLTRSMKIWLYAKRVDEDICNEVKAHYVDIVDNLDLIQNNKNRDVGELLKTNDSDTKLWKVIKGFYQEVAGYDMSIDVNSYDDITKEALDKMKQIPFLNQRYEKNNVTKFAEIIKSIIEEEDKDKQNGNGQGNNQNSDEKSDESVYDNMPSVQGKIENGNYKKEDVEKAINEIVPELNEGELKDFIEEVLGKLAGHAPYKKEIRENLDILKLQIEANKYPIKINKRELASNGSLIPHSHKEYELSDSPQDIDIFNSMGKPFIPGLGKTWKKIEGQTYSENKSTPNAVIMKDISGSMESCEPYAEIACIAAANSFLNNDAAVAVYLFNNYVCDKELNKGYQKNKNSIDRGLCTKNSGGTSIDKNSLSKLEKMINQSDKEVDVVLVTDLEIDGRDKLFDYLYNNKKRNHVTIIYTGEEKINDLISKYNDSKFSIYHITKPEDIPKVVIGGMK